MLKRMLDRGFKRSLNRILLVSMLCGALANLGFEGVARAGFLQDRVDADRALASLLDAAPTRAALEARLGVAATKCLETSDTTEICGWEISRQNPIWNEIVDILGTRAVVSVVCALPKDAQTLRPAGSCSASPRESNRDLFKGARGTPDEGRIEDPIKERELLRQYETVAQAWLDQARTLVSMTRLVGKLPDRCQKTPDGERRCVWRLGQKDFGHGTVAMSIGTSMRGRVWLRCAFPLSGAPRGEESCSVDTGS